MTTQEIAPTITKAATYNNKGNGYIRARARARARAVILIITYIFMGRRE